jgi:hypothetical protein
VRVELAPWEKQIGEAQSLIDVAAAERDALLKRCLDAEKRLKVGLSVTCTPARLTVPREEKCMQPYQGPTFLVAEAVCRAAA